MNYSLPDLTFSNIKPGVEYAVKEFQLACVQNAENIKNGKKIKRLEQMFDRKEDFDNFTKKGTQYEFFKSLSQNDIKIMEKNIKTETPYIPWAKYDLITSQLENRRVCQERIVTFYCNISI